MTVQELTDKARDWQIAVRHDAVGMGSATPGSLEGVVRARQDFLDGLKTVRPAELADALTALRHLEGKVRVALAALQG